MISAPDRSILPKRIDTGLGLCACELEGHLGFADAYSNRSVQMLVTDMPDMLANFLLCKLQDTAAASSR